MQTDSAVHDTDQRQGNSMNTNATMAGAARSNP